MNRQLEERVRLIRTQCKALAEAARRMANAADARPLLEERLRKALTHVELAFDALDADPLEAEPGRSGPILGSLANIVDRLARGRRIVDEHGSRLKLASSIASLRQVPRRSRNSSFEGTSASFSIGDFLGFLQVQGKTGVLEVRLQRERVLVYIQAGDVIEAYSDNSPEGCRLGEILVQTGALEQERLDAFFVYHNSSQGRVGRALEIQDLVSEEDLQRSLSDQTLRLVRRLLAGKNAPFTFSETELDDSGSDVRLSVVELLLESARQEDEETRRLEQTPPPLPATEPTAEDEICDADLAEIRAALRKHELDHTSAPAAGPDKPSDAED